MSLPPRLISWAQNEEMIDSYFLAHGRDCLEAAAELRGCQRDTGLLQILFIIGLAISILAALGGAVVMYGEVTTLRAENTRLLSRTCPQTQMETPTIIQRRQKVVG